jgi:hypothetical protein
VSRLCRVASVSSGPAPNGEGGEAFLASLISVPCMAKNSS